MNILSVFLALFSIAGSLHLEINSQVTVEVMSVVGSEVQNKLDKKDGTKKFLLDVFGKIQSFYATFCATLWFILQWGVTNH